MRVRRREHREHLLQLDRDQAREAVLGRQGDERPSGLTATDFAAPTSKLAQRVNWPGAAASGGGKMNAGGSARQETPTADAGGGAGMRTVGLGPTSSTGGQSGASPAVLAVLPPVAEPPAPAAPREAPAPGLVNPLAPLAPAPLAPPARAEASPMAVVGVDTELASRPASAVGASARALHPQASTSAIPVAADSHRTARTIQRNVGMRPIATSTAAAGPSQALLNRARRISRTP